MSEVPDLLAALQRSVNLAKAARADRNALAVLLAKGISGVDGAIPERDDFEIADAIIAAGWTRGGAE